MAGPAGGEAHTAGSGERTPKPYNLLDQVRTYTLNPVLPVLQRKQHTAQHLAAPSPMPHSRVYSLMHRLHVLLLCSAAQAAHRPALGCPLRGAQAACIRVRGVCSRRSGGNDDGSNGRRRVVFGGRGRGGA